MLKSGSPVRFASAVSLIVSLSILGAKFWAYWATGSYAILSDAFESCVNVLGAFSALAATSYAAQPADRDHPYGHGKAEYFSAAFEGGLLTFAGGLIITKAIDALIKGPVLQQVGLGLILILGAGLANAMLGIFLLVTGKQKHSLALIASGRHVLSDFWTSLGVILGLGAVKITGISHIDPVIAIGLGGYIIFVGFNLVRHSAGGLMDAEDNNAIRELHRIFHKHLSDGIIRIHSTRTIRPGSKHHVDSHIVVPEFWDVARAHQETGRFERAVMADYFVDCEFHFHFDPCRRNYCKVCCIDDCPIRKLPFEKRTDISIEELTSPREPKEFRRR